MSWTNLITAPDQLIAEMWAELLSSHGVRARVRAGDTQSFLGVSAYPCRILVDEDDLTRAQELMKSEMGVDFTDEG
ncbi:MAG: DUF2007 domain-containing protein [SAR202 cluster bacterium]|nr:DUF2007 domain-containing protein [SAR202 cluster bacterium]MDP6513676.1 DUF2007 domain-containing protein [SAR202 cluster bacterium]MDP6712998.1 DUF2007 domain-containing protein [SAR202 cluster bacterium]